VVSYRYQSDIKVISLSRII